MADAIIIENKESEWKNRERGALWKKQGKNQNYLTGVIKSLDDMGQEVKNKVIVFTNKKQDERERSRLHYL